MEFVETVEFSDDREEHFGGDESFRLLQSLLVMAPEYGAVLPGCGGFRKIRWADQGRGKGKRGGLRVIYLYVPDVEVIILAMVYDKDEADDVSPAGKGALARMADEIRANLRAEKPKRD